MEEKTQSGASKDHLHLLSERCQSRNGHRKSNNTWFKFEDEFFRTGKMRSSSNSKGNDGILNMKGLWSCRPRPSRLSLRGNKWRWNGIECLKSNCNSRKKLSALRRRQNRCGNLWKMLRGR